MNTLDELILKWQEGDLTNDELRQLNALLARSENRAVLRDEFLLSAGLRQVCSCPSAKVIPLPAARNRLAWIAVAAACVLFLAIIVRLGFLPAETQITTDGKSLRPGDTLAIGEGQETTIRFDSGKSSIQLRGESVLEVVSLGVPKEFRLRSGTIAASVAPQDKPLVVHTPQARARVLGTEFTLSALPRSTRLDVAHGAVRLVRAADGQELEVRQNQFATVAPEVRFAALQSPPGPWRDRDIGGVAMHGLVFVDGGKCLIKGSGQNTCLKKDQLHFMFQKAQGDFALSARLVSFSARSSGSRAGVMLRRTLQTACRQAFVCFRGDGQIEIQCRPESEAQELFTMPASLPLWLRVTREGKEVKFAISKDNLQWQEVASETVDLGDQPFAGLAVTSFDNEVLDESVFDNIALHSIAL
jgi:ferric-dicitrate binding protein FerR (iron transport regulator)/regulation of enolase protein 1 (concanavalin A-like superfamily)